MEYVLLSSHHSVRLDKWLWAARFYKTRRLAVDAIQKGKVKINGEKSKPARMIKPEDLLSISQGPHHIDLTVTGMADKRGPARVAQTLYQETSESIQTREKNSLARQQGILLSPASDSKPDKKQRRQIRHLKERI